LAFLASGLPTAFVPSGLCAFWSLYLLAFVLSGLCAFRPSAVSWGATEWGVSALDMPIFPFHDFQCEAIFISLGRVSFSGERMVTKRLIYLSLELNGMSADSWCWVFCPLVFVSLSPWGAVALTSVYVRARALVLSGSLFVSLLAIVEVFLFQPGRYVAVVSMETLFVFLLYCCLTIAGRLFVLLLARFSLDLTLFSWRFYWLFRFVNEFSAFEG
jgi:hypothetical protein